MAFKLFAVYCISIVFGGIVINKVHSNTLGLAVVWGRAGGVSRVRKKGWVRPCSGWALSSSPSPSWHPWPKYDPNDQRRWVFATRKLNKIAGTVPSPTTLHLSSLLASGYMFAHHVSKLTKNGEGEWWSNLIVSAWVVHLKNFNLVTLVCFVALRAGI